MRRRHVILSVYFVPSFFHRGVIDVAKLFYAMLLAEFAGLQSRIEISIQEDSSALMNIRKPFEGAKR